MASRPEGSPRRRDHQRVVARPPEPDATRPRARTVMQSAHAEASCQTWSAPIMSVAVPFANQPKRLRRAKFSIRSAALARPAAGLVIRVAISRARVTHCGARIRHPSLAGQEGLGAERRPGLGSDTLAYLHE